MDSNTNTNQYNLGAYTITQTKWGWAVKLGSDIIAERTSRVQAMRKAHALTTDTREVTR